MFHSCTYLVYPPVLPATSLTAGGEYAWMFQNCTSLVTTPALPATTVSVGSYQGMFQGCTSLTETPYLPALTLAQACYASMFYQCTGITKMNELPATTLAKGCYSEFVRGCTNLKVTPRVLPALTLAESCYSYMFYGCTKLGRAPILPAATLVKDCYDYMFYNCSNLRRIECYALGTNPSTSSTDEYNSNYTASWVKGVSSRGTYYKPLNSSSWPTGTNGYPSGWAVDTAHEFTPFTIEFFSLTGAVTGGAFKWIKSDSSAATIGLTYNGSNGAVSGTAMSTTAGVTISNVFKMTLYTDSTTGTGNSSNSTYNYLSLYSGYAIVYGRLSDMAGGRDEATCYLNLFKDSIGLVAADLYISESTNRYKYTNLFEGCTNLGAYNYGLVQLMKNRGFTCPPRYVPKLPATTLAAYCYSGMFNNCTSLTDPPELPATTLDSGCYYKMFQGCTGLIEEPRLPAMNLSGSCYMYMFKGCTSLRRAPELPAMHLDTMCYANMFENCTSLVIAPEILPATALAQNCYYGMFMGCVSLCTAPILPAQTLVSNCYNSMFNGCTNLSYIECYATNISATNCLLNWLYKSNNTIKGLFVGGSTHATFPTGNSGIPSNWDVYYGYLYNKLFTIYNTTANTITISWKNSGGNSKSLYYRTQANGSTSYSAWGPLATGGSISLAAYAKVEFRGNNSTPAALGTGSAYNYFTISGAVIVYGNIGSLLSNSITVSRDTTADYGSFSYAFKYLFYNNGAQSGKEIYAQGLKFPYKAIGYYGCHRMFYTTGLVAAPNLPMSEVGGHAYSMMYQYCSSLIDPGRIKALRLDSESSCENMYQSCTKLTVAPDLPATFVGNSSYYRMFSNCSSLAVPMKYLPAIISSTDPYSYMFNSCSNLLRTPILVDQGHSTYTGMFSSCTGLKKVTIYSTSISSWTSTILNLPTNLTNCLIITDIASAVTSPPGTGEKCQVVKVNSDDDLVNEVWVDDFQDGVLEYTEGDDPDVWAEDPYTHGCNRYIRTGGTIWLNGTEFAIYEYLGYGDRGYYADFYYVEHDEDNDMGYGLVPIYSDWAPIDRQTLTTNSLVWSGNETQKLFFRLKLSNDGGTYGPTLSNPNDTSYGDIITAVVS